MAEQIQQDIKKTEVTLSINVCFMLFLYAPLKLYFTNKNEFWFDIYLLGPVMVGVFFLFSVISIMLLRVFRKMGKMWAIIMVCYFSSFLSLYIQGNYLVGNLPPLDGRKIEWSLYSDGRLPSAIIWSIVLILTIFLYTRIGLNRFTKVIRYVSSFLGMILMVTLITLCVMNKGLEKAHSFFCTTNNEFQMSTNKNFVVLILDAVDARYFEKLINDDETKESLFNDFTFYNNVCGAYPHTKDSIPMIMSGIWYENQCDYEDYLKDVYENSPLFNRLKQEDYTMGLFEEDSFLVNNCMNQFDNMQQASYGVNSLQTFVRWQIMMVGYSYAPFDLKRFCFINPTAFSELKRSPQNSTIFTPSDLVFYNSINESPITCTEQNVFKFIHVEGAHVPFDLDESLNSPKDGTYEDKVAASVTLATEYIYKLKQAQVYDNSVIIIMADHGYNINGESLDRQNPLLMVKGLEESHEFEMSEAPISFEDLQMAYGRLLDGTPGNAVFDWKTGDNRERRYMYYEYPKDEHIMECVLKGDASESNNLSFTGKEYVYNKKESNAGVNVVP